MDEIYIIDQPRQSYEKKNRNHITRVSFSPTMVQLLVFLSLILVLGIGNVRKDSRGSVGS